MQPANQVRKAVSFGPELLRGEHFPRKIDQSFTCMPGCSKQKQYQSSTRSFTVYHQSC